MLEKLRGKKVIFVGDSLNRNMWVSFLCLLESSIPPSSNKTLIFQGNLRFFKDTVSTINFSIFFFFFCFLFHFSGFSDCVNLDFFFINYSVFSHSPNPVQDSIMSFWQTKPCLYIPTHRDQIA